MNAIQAPPRLEKKLPFLIQIEPTTFCVNASSRSGWECPRSIASEPERRKKVELYIKKRNSAWLHLDFRIVSVRSLSRAIMQHGHDCGTKTDNGAGGIGIGGKKNSGPRTRRARCAFYFSCYAPQRCDIPRGFYFAHQPVWCVRAALSSMTSGRFFFFQMGQLQLLSIVTCSSLS